MVYRSLPSLRSANIDALLLAAVLVLVLVLAILVIRGGAGKGGWRLRRVVYFSFRRNVLFR